MADDIGLIVDSLARLEYLLQFQVCLTSFLSSVILAFVFLYSFRFR